MFFVARERSVESTGRAAGCQKHSAGNTRRRSQRTTLILIVQIGQINKFGKDLPLGERLSPNSRCFYAALGSDVLVVDEEIPPVFA